MWLPCTRVPCWRAFKFHTEEGKGHARYARRGVVEERVSCLLGGCSLSSRWLKPDCGGLSRVLSAVGSCEAMRPVVIREHCRLQVEHTMHNPKTNKIFETYTNCAAETPYHFNWNASLPPVLPEFPNTSCPQTETFAICVEILYVCKYVCPRCEIWEATQRISMQIN